jgi:hypothetical protein
MAINFYEDLSVYNHVVVEGGFYAGWAVDTNYDLKIKGASLLSSTLTVSGIVTLSSVANASSDPDKFLCINGSNQVEYRTGAEVLSDIGAASSSSLSNYLPLAGGTMTGTTSHGDNVKSRFGTGNDLSIYATGTTSILDIPAGDFYIGDYQTFDTGSFAFARVSSESGLYQAEEGWFSIRTNGSNGHTYIGSDSTDVVEIDHHSMLLYDNMQLNIGSSEDLRLVHNGSDSFIQNFTGDLQIQNNATDKDILFRNDDGNGALTTYFFLDGSLSDGTYKYTKWTDYSVISLGTGNDFQLFHDSTKSRVENLTGNLEITQKVTDGDIIFNCDDGSGGETQYFRVDGGEARTIYTKDLKTLDNTKILIGNGADLQIYHDSADSIIKNTVGNLYISNSADDKDIIFQGDNGSGGLATYFYLDGGNSHTNFQLNARWVDNAKAQFGNSGDLQIYHNGTDSYIDDSGTGDFRIRSNFLKIEKYTGETMATFNDDNAVSLYYDNSKKFETTSNGVTITGGIEVGGGSSRFTNSVRFTANATFDDNSKAIFGDDTDLQIYHNGSNSIIEDTGTGDLVVKFSNDLLIEGQDGANLINCNEGNSVQLYYNGSEKLETKSTGIEVTGDVLDRDIPCMLVSNFSDDSSTTSYIYMPFNSTSDGTSNNYYHYFAAPAAGKVVSIMIMHVFGTMSSSFTTQIRVYKNGTAVNTSGELTPSNGTNDGSYVEYTPGTVFAKGDRLQFAYQKSATSKYWRGVAATMVIELTDYDI